jgi:two-component system, chemotaxis family, protein-glutamate methylesterase/glutaminase
VNARREIIKVLVVDDSALIRHLLAQVINSQEDMVCVGAATDPLMARQMIKDLNPDVLTLDIEMPKMDGMDFLEKIMRLRPMPVLMISTLTERGSETALRALELGAVDFVAKPKVNVQDSFAEYEEEISAKIRMAARAKMFNANMNAIGSSTVLSASGRQSLRVSKKRNLIVVGASTGGTEAIKTFLLGMPADSPGIVIVQHMPPAFTKSFANRLNVVCSHLQVKEAEEGDRVLPGHVYIAPGGFHLWVKRLDSGYTCRLSDDPPVNRHCPSVEVLFNSVADGLAQQAIGVMLTGMGKDGAEAMLKMRRAGAYNFAQDEASCVVYGMPREAVAHGGVNESVPLSKMAEKVIEQL